MTIYTTGKPGLAFTLWLAIAMNGASFAVAAGEDALSSKVTADSDNQRQEPVVEDGADDSTTVITVTATRTERRVDEVPASVSVLTKKELARKHRQNAEDMLRDVEGLDFSRQAGVAHQTIPTIRGVGGSFAGSTTQVLIDGLPQDAATSGILGHGGLNFIDIQDIEQIELVRGPVSALYGYGAIGGVINVIPKRWQGDAGAEINASYGSNDTWIEGAAVGTATDRFDVRVSFYDAKSDGFIAVPERNRFGQIDYGPRNWTDRKVSLNGGYFLDEHQEITFNYYEYDTDSAIYGGERPFDRQAMGGKTARLGYQFDISNATTVKVLYQLTRLTQGWTSDQEEWYGNIGDFGPAFAFTRHSDTRTLMVEMHSRLSDNQELIAGISHDSGDSTESFSWAVRDSDHTTNALYVQDELTLGAYSLTAGLRYDRIELSPIVSNGSPVNGNSSVDNVVSPRVGLAYKLSAATSLYSSLGSAFLPAQNKFKFVEPSVTRVDNPDLDPENSLSFEIGMRNRFPVGKLRTAVYRTDFEDKIVLGLDPVSGLDQWQNRALRRVLGVEIAFDGDLGNGWYPYANYTHLKAEDQAAEGAEFTKATRVSPNKFNFGVTYESGGWSATFNGRWVDSQYLLNLTEEQKAGSYFEGDAQIRFKVPTFNDKLDGYLAVNNITGKKYTPFNIDEWSDGRSVTLGFNGKF